LLTALRGGTARVVFFSAVFLVISFSFPECDYPTTGQSGCQ
jgi:hypothetical protein